MMKFWQEIQRKKETKRALLKLFAEMNDNLEAYYVMFQLGKLRFFCLDSWKAMNDAATIPFDEKINRYAQVLDDYNQTLTVFKEYEQWYSSDPNNKTKENGQMLHAKKEEANQKFQQGLEALIIAARDALKIQLLDMKILKK